MPQTRVDIGVCDLTGSEQHDEPGSDLTALFTVMHTSVSYLKLKRVCLTCTSGQQVDLKQTDASLCFSEDQFEIQTKSKPNSHRNTCKHIQHNILWRGLK